MLGEQTRDWAIALGGITDLPLLGAPSTAGGRGLGPAYYWVLWLGRVDDRRLHGQPAARRRSRRSRCCNRSPMRGCSSRLSRRVHWVLALAMCLLIASAPFDIAISQVIWNPPVAAALHQDGDRQRLDDSAARARLDDAAQPRSRPDGGIRLDGRAVSLVGALRRGAVARRARAATDAVREAAGLRARHGGRSTAESDA